MDTRAKIVEAAARVLREQGFARATTKEIARAAGYSEAALYKHFRDKTEIFTTVLAEQSPGLLTTLVELVDNPTGATLRANLTRVAVAAMEFYADTFPMAASVFSSRELLDAHRTRLGELGRDPSHVIDVLARYLSTEQRLGRLRAGDEPRAIASLLLGACFQQGFLIAFGGTTPRRAELETLAGTLVAPLVIAPARASRASGR
ncbi:TetR/AcrR family transcriptional regulator [Amycolatopsis suaedae]|uniref:TetR/AcrR family transcriptional regulator n=1 Tax=Amycolatopsis suaedae TaxID=2510978 RepID=A0A4Q7JDT8_9PSEU|nr:TetR/AcrR family transcriptional regulator [Amycolatopsis suaedae]RZQ65368.1 TetR/AcrR family transcriptional regulator [Amycolatopsis suaedae]